MNNLLYITVMFDLKYKLDFIEFMLVKLHEDEKGSRVRKIIQETLFSYNNYKEKIEP